MNGTNVVKAAPTRAQIGLFAERGGPLLVPRHADAQTTMDYTHTVTADERRIAGELGRILHVTARNEQAKGSAPSALTPMIQ
jgi:hypothetical protein